MTNWGPLNEAKPIEFNNKIVALWGGSSDGRLAGVGVYDRTSHSWPIQFALPATLAKGGPHSVARLPGDYFAVAHVGTITGTSFNGAVLLFDKFGTLKDTEGLGSAHGVEWDEKTKKVYAVGFDYVKSYEFVGEDLRPESSWTLPGTVRNGHDLRRKRTDTKFLVTGNTQEWAFDPTVSGSAAFTTFTKDGGADWGNGVKSLDQGFDDVTVQAFMGSDSFFFGNRGPEPADFCMSPYKFRWIYAQGTPVYNEEEPPAEETQTQPAEPFLWARKQITTTEQKTIKDMWLGGAAGTSADAAYSIVKASADAGEIPFIKFYHWGDDGSPTMDNFGAATTSQVNGWENYALQDRECARHPAWLHRHGARVRHQPVRDERRVHAEVRRRDEAHGHHVQEHRVEGHHHQPVRVLGELRDAVHVLRGHGEDDARAGVPHPHLQQALDLHGAHVELRRPVHRRR